MHITRVPWAILDISRQFSTRFSADFGTIGYKFGRFLEQNALHLPKSVSVRAGSSAVEAGRGGFHGHSPTHAKIGRCAPKCRVLSGVAHGTPLDILVEMPTRVDAGRARPTGPPRPCRAWSGLAHGANSTFLDLLTDWPPEKSSRLLEAALHFRSRARSRLAHGPNSTFCRKRSRLVEIGRAWPMGRPSAVGMGPWDRAPSKRRAAVEAQTLFSVAFPVRVVW